MSENQIKFLEENKNIYISQFKEFMRDYFYDLTFEEIKEEFKKWIWWAKDIDYIDFRYKICKEIFNELLKA